MSVLGGIRANALALFARERTGRGLKVSTSLLAAGAWANATTIQAQLRGAKFHPKWTRDTAPSFGAVYYRTRDDLLARGIAVESAH